MSVKDQLVKMPVIQQLVKYYGGLAARDQKVLQLLAVVVSIVLIYAMIWLPSQRYFEDAHRDMLDSQAVLQFVQSNVKNAKMMSENSAGRGQSLAADEFVSTVSGSASRQSLEVKRLEPSGDRKLRVWLEGASFNSLVLWLQDLNKKHGIGVAEISVDKEWPRRLPFRLFEVSSRNRC